MSKDKKQKNGTEAIVASKQGDKVDKKKKQEKTKVIPTKDDSKKKSKEVSRYKDA